MFGVGVGAEARAHSANFVGAPEVVLLIQSIRHHLLGLRKKVNPPVNGISDSALTRYGGLGLGIRLRTRAVSARDDLHTQFQLFCRLWGSKVTRCSYIGLDQTQQGTRIRALAKIRGNMRLKCSYETFRITRSITGKTLKPK